MEEAALGVALRAPHPGWLLALECEGYSEQV